MSNEVANRLSDPAACYGTPEALLNDVALTKEQKVAALRSWAYDAVEDVEHVAPSKQHGLPRD